MHVKSASYEVFFEHSEHYGVRVDERNDRCNAITFHHVIKRRVEGLGGNWSICKGELELCASAELEEVVGHEVEHEELRWGREVRGDWRLHVVLDIVSYNCFLSASSASLYSSSTYIKNIAQRGRVDHRCYQAHKGYEIATLRLS